MCPSQIKYSEFRNLNKRKQHFLLTQKEISISSITLFKNITRKLYTRKHFLFWTSTCSERTFY